MKRPSRRDFLRLGAAGAVLAPFVPLLEAHGDVAGPPKRLILVYTPNGMSMNYWRPQGTEHDFTLSPILAPLAPHKQELIVLDGIFNNGGQESPKRNNGHAAMTSLFTGTPWTPEDPNDVESYPWPTNASVDQIVAAATGKPALNLGVASKCAPGDIYSKHCFARGPKDVVVSEQDPFKVFDNLFGEFVLPPDQLAKLRFESKSTIDVLKGELSSLRQRVGKEDQFKMDAHLEGILALEQKLGMVGPNGCTMPVAPEQKAVTEYANLPWVTDTQIDLLTRALACDLTRVVGFQWAYEARTISAPWVGDLSSQGLHTLSHETDAASLAWKADFETWLATQVAGIVDRLKNTPDIDGSPLMDSTLLVWGCCMANGWTHSIYNIPHVVVAGKNIGWSTGRYLRFGDYDPDRHPWDEPHPTGGKANARLLVSICQAMGLDIDTYGDPAYGSGPLSELV